MAGLLTELSDDNFKSEVLDAKGVVVVDFWAAWCPPCLAMAPMFEKMAAKFEGRAKFCKFDVQKNEKIPSQYGIMNIPTIIIFKDGKESETLVGLQDERTFPAVIEKAISG